MSDRLIIKKTNAEEIDAISQRFADMRDSSPETVRELKDEIERLKNEVEKHKVALSELCQLKAIKDKHGKTSEYNIRQPVAWSVAFSLIKEDK